MEGPGLVYVGSTEDALGGDIRAERPNEGKSNLGDSGGKAFQADRTASAKAPRQQCLRVGGWCGWSTVSGGGQRGNMGGSCRALWATGLWLPL